jgi:hypothetical protein
MKFRKIALGLGVVGLLVGIGVAWKLLHRPQLAPPEQQGPVVQAADYKLSEPYTHENLTVFLVHGRDLSQGKTYLTLQEALEQKKVVVHETEQVNELSVENLSPSEEVYIQSGDILKGGKQDRVLPYDLVAAPKSGKIPLGSYCVEQGRWQKRGEESVAFFDSSSSMSNNNQIKVTRKMSAKHDGQSIVWKEVEKQQTQLGNNLHQTISASKSPSSLQLSLENSKVQEETDKFVQKLSSILEEKTDVIGFAVVINGKLYSADVYASPELFKKLWPRLLRATAVEAIARQEKDSSYEPVGADAMKAFLKDAETGEVSHAQVSERIHVILRETKEGILFETCDRSQGNLVIHRSFVVK